MSSALAALVFAVAGAPAAAADAERLYQEGVAIAATIDDASVFRKAGLARDMRDAWLQAVALDPDHARARVSLFQFYLAAPGIIGGGRDKALGELAHIARIADARPDDLALRLDHGLLCQSVDDWACAAAAFELVVAKDPGAMMAWYQIGRTALRSGAQLERGAEALERYLTHTPGDGEPSRAWGYTRLGQVYAAQGRPADARAAIEAALALEPDHEEA